MKWLFSSLPPSLFLPYFFPFLPLPMPSSFLFLFSASSFLFFIYTYLSVTGWIIVFDLLIVFSFIQGRGDTYLWNWENWLKAGRREMSEIWGLGRWCLSHLLDNGDIKNNSWGGEITTKSREVVDGPLSHPPPGTWFIFE